MGQLSFSIRSLLAVLLVGFSSTLASAFDDLGGWFSNATPAAEGVYVSTRGYNNTAPGQGAVWAFRRDPVCAGGVNNGLTCDPLCAGTTQCTVNLRNNMPCTNC